MVARGTPEKQCHVQDRTPFAIPGQDTAPKRAQAETRWIKMPGMTFCADLPLCYNSFNAVETALF
jgi:hypothetical protein